jgi:HAMP domain-containing protein
MIRKTSAFLVLCATALLAVGCANQKEPATKAIADAESALAAVRDDAAKYAGGDLQSIESTLSGLKDSLGKGDFKAVLAGAPALLTAVSSLKDTAAVKKTEAMAAMETAKTEFGTLSGSLGGMMTALQSRMDILSKAKKLPKGLDAAKFDGAKSGFEAAKSAMAAATAAAGSGDFTAALAKAQEAKAKGTEVLQALGMPTG